MTWIENSTNEAIQTDVAIVKYTGDFPGRSHHGLVKDDVNNPKFVRTKSSVREHLKNELKHRSVKIKDVEREMNQNESSDFNKHRHEKQLRSIKHEATKTTNGNTVTKNIADQIICVEEMAKTHEFVKSVKHIHKQQHPVITLYRSTNY